MQWKSRSRINQSSRALSAPLPTTPAAGPRTADRRTSTRQTNTPAARITTAEHGRVAEHVGHDKEAHVRAANVDLFEVGDAAVAGGDGNVLELDVHVVLGLEEAAAVGLARGNFECDNVALQSEVSRKKEKESQHNRGKHTCASLSSLIGMPIVDVIMRVEDGVWSARRGVVEGEKVVGRSSSRKVGVGGGASFYQSTTSKLGGALSRKFQQPAANCWEALRGRLRTYC